ncbi:MAG TPA: replicative DNA helicase [Anaerolineaceae bacterium]|nr:replicative DNA helicase [Anaerolineaceae bacterium]HOF27878.1 replicative DNA helicase [Anaerolineaceae bacterium]
MSDQFEQTNSQSSSDNNLLFDRDMEEALIGSVLITPDAYLDAAPLVSAEDFYLHRNRWIWEAFIELFKTDSYFDVLTVKDALEASGHLEDVGGLDYLISLTNRVPSSQHAESYARNINALAVRRRLLTAANDIAKLAYRKDTGVDNVISDAEKAIFGVSQERYKRDLVPISDAANDYLERLLVNASLSDGVTGLDTGLKAVDKALGGLQRSDLIIVAGRPGMGKTGFLIGIAKHVGLAMKRNVAFFTLEMSAEQLIQRMIAQETSIDSQKLRSAKLSDMEAQEVVHALGVLSESRIFVDDTPAITPLQMRTKCRRMQMEIGLDLVIVDYLQLMSGDTRTENRVQEVSYISRYLKVLARDLNVPVIAAAQLSRAVEQRQDKTPVLSDLRESGSLEQDADIVMFINRPEQMKEESPLHNLTKLIVAKHRNGPTNSGIDLVFIEKLAMFRDKAYVD